MKYNLLRGTHLKTSSSLTYVQMVLLPVLTALFDHLSVYEFGSDLLRNISYFLLNFCSQKRFFNCTLEICITVDDIQVACYKILNNLYTFGTDASIYKDRYGHYKIDQLLYLNVFIDVIGNSSRSRSIGIDRQSVAVWEPLLQLSRLPFWNLTSIITTRFAFTANFKSLLWKLKTSCPS